MKKRILLADADESVRKMLGRVLASEGYEVAPARTAAEALTQALAGDPDLVLLDSDTSEPEGWANRLPSGVPVIALTGDPSQLEQAGRAHFAAFLEKPLDLAMLLKKIGELLDRSEKQPAPRLEPASARTP